MNIGAQIAVGCHFQNFADVDDKSSGYGWSVDPAASAFHLQAALLILQQDADEAGILMRADALVAFVARDLDSG